VFTFLAQVFYFVDITSSFPHWSNFIGIRMVEETSTEIQCWSCVSAQWTFYDHTGTFNQVHCNMKPFVLIWRFHFCGSVLNGNKTSVHAVKNIKPSAVVTVICYILFLCEAVAAKSCSRP